MKKTNAFLGLMIVMAGCEYEQLSPPVDCTGSTLTVGLSGTVTNANCGQSNGAFTLVASGGEGSYAYTLDNETNEDGNFSGLSAGVYEVSVEDATGCSVSMEVSVQNEDGLNITVAVTESGCETAEGVIAITATGGETPYQFALNNASFGSEATFTALEAGAYEITALDGSGCEITQSVTVLTGISYAASVASIITNDCAISGCHAGSVSPDLRSFSNIQSNASRIKSRTASGSMPPNKKLTQSEIDAIGCWVDDGALNN